jgi:hypothetical protein
MTPKQSGVYRAQIILRCPTTNEEWEADGINVAQGKAAYESIASATVASGALDPVEADSMLVALEQGREVLRKRISPTLAETIIARTFNNNEAHPDAIVKVANWASGFMPDTEHAAALRRVLDTMQPDLLADRMEALRRVGGDDLGEAAQRIITEHNANAGIHKTTAIIDAVSASAIAAADVVAPAE